MARRKSSSSVFFPWERRHGARSLAGRSGLRLAVIVALVVAAFVWLRGREEHAASVRATRASISTAFHGTMAFRADHGGACPRDVTELVAQGYLRELPMDAWGRPLRLTCPGRRDARGFELASDGPDGLPGGLDRVE